MVYNGYSLKEGIVMVRVSQSEQLIEQTNQYGANNYHPLPVVISEAEGVWVKDPEGNRYHGYVKCLFSCKSRSSASKDYSCVKRPGRQSHLTSRAFHNDQLGPWYEEACQSLLKKIWCLPMNTGAEAVETAFKAARRWAYDVKEVAKSSRNYCVYWNFHGRTMRAVSLSSEEEYNDGFGPMLPGIKLIPYGDLHALKKQQLPLILQLSLIEPIQGEAGIIIPQLRIFKGSLRAIANRKMYYLLLMKFKSGLGGLEKCLPSDWEDVTSRRIYSWGKALGGGVFPISCVAANQEILWMYLILAPMGQHLAETHLHVQYQSKH